MQMNQFCCRLADFDETNLEDARDAFKHTTPFIFVQPWRSVSEDGFMPGAVRIGWRDETLFVFAELTDADIFTRASCLNERMWELGDVFEMFVRPVRQEAYYEFHVTPNNQRLQLRFPSTEALRDAQFRSQFQPFMIEGDAIRSATWVLPDIRLWVALARIPAASVCEAALPLSGSQWRFSFSRYDYTRGRERPIVSSVSPHRTPDFHSQTEWFTLEFLS